MASLLSWLGNVAAGVERQLNPFDGGATYSNPNPQKKPIAIPNYHPGVVGSINQATGSNYAQGGGQSAPQGSVLRPAPRPPIVIPDYHTAQAPVKPPAIKVNALNALVNPIGAASQWLASPQGRQTTISAAQSLARTAPELATTVGALKDQNITYHPNSPLEKTLFGSTPVQNIQAKMRDTQAKHGTAAGIGEGALSLLQDVPAGAGAAKVVGKAGKAIHEAGQVGAIGKGVKGVKAAPLPRPGGDWQLNHTYEDYAKATRKAGGTPATKEQYNAAFKTGNEPIEPRNLTPKQRQEIIKNNASQQTVNKVEINPEQGNTKGAIAQAHGISDEFQSRMGRAAALAGKLDAHDQKLLSERADPSVKITPHNPTAFNKAVAAHSDAFDYSLAAQRSAGGSTLRFGGGNYHPLYFKATPEKMDALGIDQADRLQKGKFTGFRDTTRKYRSYTSGGKVGLEPLNSSPVEDIKMYAQQGRNQIHNAALRAALEKSNPGEVADAGVGFDANGKPFRQAAGANLPFNVSANVDKYLRNYRSPYEPSSTAGKVVMKGAEKVNAGAKRALWFGSLFHYGNEAASFVGSNLFHPVVAAQGAGRAVLSMASKEGWNSILSKARETGVLDGARKMGVELPDNSRLNRVTSAYSLTQAEAAMKKGIDPNSIEGVNAGRLINKIAGQKNAAVEGSDPTLTKLVTAGAAAPKWTPSQLKLVVDAFTKPGIGRFTEGGGARNAILGKRALEAGIGIGGSALISGHLPTLQQARNEAGLNLNNPVPNVALNSKNSKGEGQVMDTPTDALGLAVGLAKNPSHFLQSRFSPAISFGTKVATNTNWNGQQLADPTAPNYLVNRIKNAAINSVTPIGVQNFTNLTNNPNNPSIAQGLVQEIGGRLKTDPNDPKYAAGVASYAATNEAKKGLNAQAANAVDRYLSSGKNPLTGKYDIPRNANDARDKVTRVLDNSNNNTNGPDAIDALVKRSQILSSKGQKVDPLWQASKDQITKVLQYQAMPPGGADRTHWFNQNKSWYIPLSNARSDFFGSLPPGDPNKPAAPIEYPNASPQVAQKQQTFFNLPDASSRAKYISENPDLQQQLDKQVQYNNDMRTATGYSPLDTFPTATPQVQKIIDTYNAIPKGGGKRGGNLYRSQWIQSHPNEYAAMTKYFTQASLYGAEQSLAQAQFKDTGVDQKGLKDIANLGQYDIGKTTDANGNTFYALGGGGSSKYSSKSGGTKVAKTITSGYKTAGAMKAPKAPSIKIKSPKSASFKAPSAKKLAVSKIPSSYTHKKLG